MSGRYRVYCHNCREEIEHCRGLYGDWMHTKTNREHCEGRASFAQPERTT